MGQFAHTTSAMPLPPAQAEAIYDMALNGERGDETYDDMVSSDLVLLNLSPQGAKLVRARQKARDGNLVLDPSEIRTSE